MHLIPVGMTDELRPLDRKIFGPLKSYSRFLFRNRMKGEVVFDAERRRSKKDACQDMVCAWEKLSSDTIQGAFEHFYDTSFWSVDDKRSIDLLKHHRAYSSSRKLCSRYIDNEESYKE